MKLSATDVMIDHEVLWMSFHQSSNPNIQNKNVRIIANKNNNNNNNEQNKLNNATSLNCILTFLLCQYIVIEVMFFLHNYM